MTDPSANPLAFYAAELRRLRSIAGMTQEQLAEATTWSAALVAAIETCRRIPSDVFSESADKALGTDGILSRLQALVERASVVPWFKDLVETERKAASIQSYESYIMPGLLQTESYARCAVSAIRPKLPEDEIERAVVLRMSRQEILEREDPPRLWAIIDESVLRRRVGSAEIMREQCEYLIYMGSRPHVAIQVIPNTRGITASYGQPYMVLTFPGKQPPLAYLDDTRSARYVRERDEVGVYSIMFDYLRSSALDDDESSAMIRSCSDGYSA
jgi:transcriptional regulator with XRE-family HTH domain